MNKSKLNKIMPKSLSLHTTSSMLPILLLLLLASASSGSNNLPGSAKLPPIKQCLSKVYPPPPETQVPLARVNLDDPPEQRWRPVVASRASEMRALLGQFRQFLVNLTGSDALMNIVDKEMVPLAKTLPEPFQSELVGVAALTNMSLGEVTLFNVFYELFPLCTSILAEDAEGRLYHARNMDFGLFLGWNSTNSSWIIADYLRPLLVNVEFYRAGSIAFVSTHYAGYIGVLTGMRPGQFSLTVNSRVGAKPQSAVGIVEWLLGIRDQRWLGVATRDALENAESYAEAKARLAGWKLVAPVYFILGGAKSGEGCVITRDRTKADVWERNSTASNHTWFLLQTNYDHWKSPNPIDNRRDPANECMLTKGQSVAATFAGLFDVLSSIPMLNKLTVYTALMQVDAGTLVAYRRVCPDPCAPW